MEIRIASAQVRNQYPRFPVQRAHQETNSGLPQDTFCGTVLHEIESTTPGYEGAGIKAASYTSQAVGIVAGLAGMYVPLMATGYAALGPCGGLDAVWQHSMNAPSLATVDQFLLLTAASVVCGGAAFVGADAIISPVLYEAGKSAGRFAGLVAGVAKGTSKALYAGFRTASR